MFIADIPGESMMLVARGKQPLWRHLVTVLLMMTCRRLYPSGCILGLFNGTLYYRTERPWLDYDPASQVLRQTRFNVQIPDKLLSLDCDSRACRSEPQENKVMLLSLGKIVSNKQHQARDIDGTANMTIQ